MILRTTIIGGSPEDADGSDPVTNSGEYYSLTTHYNCMSEALWHASELLDHMVMAGDTRTVTVTYLQRDQQ